MAVKYLNFNISIHGIDADDDIVVGFLTKWLKEATKAGITGNMKPSFNFRDEFEDDITVELIESAGQFTVTNSKR